MSIGISSGKVYDSEFDMVADHAMGNYQKSGDSPDDLIPAVPKIEYSIDREPDGPMPIPESKDAQLVTPEVIQQSQVKGEPDINHIADVISKIFKANKFNDKAWEDWLSSAPESGNVDDRRQNDTKKEENYLILRSMGAPDSVLEKYKAMPRRDLMEGRPRGEGGGGSGLPMANPLSGKWSTSETTMMKSMYDAGKSPADIAKALKGRTPSAVYNKLDSMGLSTPQAPILRGE